LALNVLVFVAYVFVTPNILAYNTLTELMAGTPVSSDEIFPNIITYMFGHYGIMHIASNMLMLVMIGRGMERRAGWTIIPVYFAAGILGAVAHMWFSDTALIGASAAVSGLFGAAIAYRAVGPGMIFYFVVVLNILPLTGVMAMVGLGDYGVSYISHLGGLAAGLGLGAFFWRFGFREDMDEVKTYSVI
jgi:membrane associated rhomboid family serine protease